MQRWRTLALVIALAGSLVQPAVLPRAAEAAPSAQPSAAADVSTTQVSVRVDSPQAMRALEATIAKTGGRIAQRGVDGGSVLVNVPSGTDAAAYSTLLAERTPVRFAEPTVIMRALEVPNDPHYPLQWGLPLVGAPVAWDAGTGSASTIVAVIDTGVDLDHPDLVNQIVPGGWDFVSGDADPSDVFGHGTSVAGVVVAQANNAAFGSGMAPGVKILPLRVLGNDGNGTSFNVAQAIRYATDHGADVINMSFGAPTGDAELSAAVVYALAHDVVLIAASGNDGSTDVRYPAREPGVVAVGAVDEKKNIASFTNRGVDLDIVAPGTAANTSVYHGIYVLANGGGWTYQYGTSFASPLVAGAAAILRSIDPAATQASVVAQLLATAEDRGVVGRDDTYGYGMLRADRAVVGFGPTPFTSSSVSSSPNADGWYKVAPTITLAADRPATISYRWDSDPTQTYTGTLQPPVGVSTLTYWASNAAGTESAHTRTFRLDTSAPSVPLGLNVVPLGTRSARLSWEASTDAPSDVKSYEISGSIAGGTSTTSLDIPGLVPGATYSFSVRARDFAGNYSAWSAPLSYTVPALTLIPIYRFYKPSTGTHFFTPSAEERDNVIARWSNIFTFEGVAYEVNANNPQPLYRFYNKQSVSHFYTASATERDTVIARWSNVFTYEGETYKVATSGPADDAVYRFYNRSNGSHFFTASTQERDTVIARWSNVYTYEGPVFYLGK